MLASLPPFPLSASSPPAPALQPRGGSATTPVPPRRQEHPLLPATCPCDRCRRPPPPGCPCLRPDSFHIRTHGWAGAGLPSRRRLAAAAPARACSSRCGLHCPPFRPMPISRASFFPQYKLYNRASGLRWYDVPASAWRHTGRDKGGRRFGARGKTVVMSSRAQPVLSCFTSSGQLQPAADHQGCGQWGRRN